MNDPVNERTVMVFLVCSLVLFIVTLVSSCVDNSNKYRNETIRIMSENGASGSDILCATTESYKVKLKCAETKEK